MTEQIQALQRWIDDSHAIVFFGGAGVSTESGIPDFRSVDGLYNQKYAWPPEEILSRTFFDARHDRRAGCGASSPRISTGSISWPAPGGCGSSTARSTAITA